jgi:hypothetical protein
MIEIFWEVSNGTILLGSIVALFIGIIILLSLIKMGRLDQFDRIIMLIATSADLLWAAYQIVASACKLGYGPDFIPSFSLSCQLYVLFNTGNLRLSNGCVAMLAIIRYRVGCKNKELKGWVLIAVFMFHCCICSILTLTAFIRWDSKRSSSGLICVMFSTEGSFSIYLMIFHTFYYLLLCIVVVVFYFKICKHWYFHLDNIKKGAIKNDDMESVKNINYQQRKIVFQGFLVILADCVTFIPSTVTYVMKLGFGYVRPPLIDGIVVWMLTTLPIVNPIITLWLQPEVNAEFWTYYFFFKDKVKKLFRCIF